MREHKPNTPNEIAEYDIRSNLKTYNTVQILYYLYTHQNIIYLNRMVDRLPDKYSQMVRKMLVYEENVLKQMCLWDDAIIHFSHSLFLSLYMCVYVWKWIFRARFISPKDLFLIDHLNLRIIYKYAVGWCGLGISSIFEIFTFSQEWLLCVNVMWCEIVWGEMNAKHIAKTIYYTLITDTE